MDAFVFSDEAPYSLVDRYRQNGMPKGVRYIASITGPWHVLCIFEFENLVDLPQLLAASLGGGSDVALSIRPAVVKRSSYDEVSSFVRIRIRTGSKAETMVRRVRKITPEADGVFGTFDVMAYAGGSDDEEMLRRVLDVRNVDGIGQTVTLRVIDYVSTSAEAPAGHRPPP